MYIWVFPEIGVPQNGWFIMEHPIKMDDLGTPIFGNIHMIFIQGSLQNIPFDLTHQIRIRSILQLHT